MDHQNADAPPVSLLGLSGSLRRASTNTGLLRLASTVLPPGVTLTMHDLGDVPFYDGDVEAAGDPPGVVRLKAALRAADGVVIACPEYNHGLSAVLKNAIDWASRPPRERPLAGKPVAVMGAGGGGGTRRAQEHLRSVLQVVGMAPVEGHEVALAKVWEVADEHGDIHDDAVTAGVRDLVGALAALAREPLGTQTG